MPDIINVSVDQITDQELKRPVSEAGLAELSRSIKDIGIIEPLIVVLIRDVYHLVAGQRRLLAAKRAGLTEVPCLVVDADHEKALAMSLHENLFREELNPVDEFRMFSYLHDKLRYTNRDIASMLSKSEAYVSQRMTMANWIPEIVDALRTGAIVFSVARELSQITDHKHARWLLSFAIRDGCNYRAARKWRADWIKTLHPAPGAVEDSVHDHTLPTSAPIVSDCFGCHRHVPFDQTVEVVLCKNCFDQLRAAMEQQDQHN